MTDRTGPIACSAQNSELPLSLTSSTTSSSTSTSTVIDHNHHGHPLKGDEAGKTHTVCSKLYPVEDRSEQCNGCLHVETKSAFSEISVHFNQKVVSKCTKNDDVSCLHHPTSNSNSKSCLEKVNGLTHNVADHSSSDSSTSRFVVNNLLNATYTSEASQAETTENHISCSSNLDLRSHESELVHQNRQADFAASHDEIEAVIGKESLSEAVMHLVQHCGSDHCDYHVKALAAKLGKTSLCDHIDSSEHLTASSDVINSVAYVVYESEKQMPDIMRLITKDLSEPYSIYTYRYFIHNWPKLCILAMVGDTCVGAIVCKLDLHKKMVKRGYIAMLAVDSEYRRRQIGSTLVTKAIEAMLRDNCDEVVLETEITNEGALRLYENLGFVRDKRLFRYYLNGVDALRLKLWLR